MQDESEKTAPVDRHPNEVTLDEIHRGAAWDERRLQVVDTCAAVLAHRGFDRTRTIDLCRATHLETATLLDYVGSKQALLVAIHDRLVDELLRHAGPISHADTPAPDRLELLGRHYAQVLDRFDHHLRVLVCSYAELVAVQPEQLMARQAELEASVAAIIRAGIEAGEFRNMDVPTSVRAWIGLLLATRRIVAGRSPSVGTNTAIFEDIFIRGIRA
jgi:AcrR family transcriptional regulator